MAKTPNKPSVQDQIILRQDMLQQQGYRIKQLEAIVPARMPAEQILRAETWAHVANKLTPYCRISVLWEDGSKFVEVMCTHVNGANSRFVALTELVDLETLVSVSAKEDLLVEDRGPLKWCVLDARTGDVLESMLATQALAVTARDDIRNNRKMR